MWNLGGKFNEKFQKNTCWYFIIETILSLSVLKFLCVDLPVIPEIWG